MFSKREHDGLLAKSPRLPGRKKNHKEEKRMKTKKQALFHSIVSLLLCITMFVGTTFAWFTDSVSSGINMIAAGNLDVELYHSNAAVTDERVDISTKLFMDLNGNPILWEPGVVSYENLRITNEGDLALAYQMSISSANENFVVDPASGAQYGLSQILKVGVVEGGITATDRNGVVQSVEDGNWITLSDFVRSGSLLPEDKGESEKTLGIVIYWEPGENDNLWNLNNGKTLNDGEFLMIDLGIKLIATQEQFESDSFGDDYDANAKTEFFPVFTGTGSVSTPIVPNDQNQVAADVQMTAGQVSATIPAGVQLKVDTNELTMTVEQMNNSGANITLGENEAMRSLNVHIEGVGEGNTVPMAIYIKEAAPKGQNAGNLKLYHVENGNTNQMTVVNGTPKHNDFTYDPATGDVTLYMATFSEIALVADQENAWNGEFDYSWYTNAAAPIGDDSTTDYKIANADQLAAFGAIVGGMAESINPDSFDGKTVKLLADINLGYGVENHEYKIFYPIGYYNSTGSYDKTSGGSVTSSVSSFEGTFDGNGHTIANFYQNTWEMFGDYNDGYSGTPNHYKDAMGLFGYVVNGTVKNLTVDHFSSDGEFTPTGVIAAYAVNSTFENIAITNCNPRVYNTGNGGIVGIGGNSDDPDTYELTFTNITIDNSNIISALWGSWDVACGGLVGMFRGAGHVYMTNCHVAAQIDVYNDVCGNYQYYWYRYAGMMVGTNKNMITDANGYTVPETSKFHAENCTVHFGEWNDYYYCELVANSLASYTHDHQFSRLEQIDSLDKIKSGDTWTKTGNFLLISGDTKTCYHIVKNSDGTLKQHLHTDAGEETVSGKTVLKEDKQIVYLPFNQLFTGYGWGVKHIPVYNGEDYAFKGITILDREVADSETKFATKFTGDFLYRVGNANAVSVGSLFDAAYILDADGNLTENKYTINSSGVWVTIEKVDENSNVSGTFTKATDGKNWTEGTIKFSGTGVVKVIIQDYNFCTPTVLYLEVVDAYNSTTTVSVPYKYNNTNYSVVLLNNISGSFTVYSGFTLYGNGFEVTLPTSHEAKATAGFVGYITMNDGNLDNVRIVGPVYPVMNIYQSQSINQSTQKEEYFYNSILINGGNCTISNSYISGSRTAICVRGGNNVVIENTTLSGGAVANMHVAGVNSLVLRNLSTVQKDEVDSYDKGVTTHGMGIYVDASAANIVVEGSLNQYNWLSQDQWENVVGEYVNFFPQFFTDSQYSAFQHNRDGNVYVNMAFIFACDWTAAKLNIAAQESDLTYQKKDGISITTPNGTVTGGVYSVVDAGTLTDKMYYAPVYKSTGYNPVAPTFDWDNSANHDTDDEINPNDSYCVYDNNNGIMSIGLSGDKILDLSGISITKSGAPIAYTAYLNGNKISGNTVTITADAGTTQTLTFKTAVNSKGYDKSGNEIAGTIEYVWNITLEVATLSYPAPEWTFTNNSRDTTNCYYVYYKTSQGYGEAVPIYDGIKVKYYDADGKLTEKDFSNITDEIKGKGDAWTLNTGLDYTFDGCKLTMTATGSYKLGVTGLYLTTYNNKVYAYPSALDNDGNVRPKKNQYDFNVTIKYTFTDPHGQSTTQTTVNWYGAKANGSQITDVQWQTFDVDNGKKYNDTCIAEGSMITMADGTQKPVEELNVGDMVLAFDHVSGQFEATPVIFNTHVDDLEPREYDVLNLEFSNGEELKIVGSHGLFDMTLMKYVYLDYENYTNFIGHKFFYAGSDGTSNEHITLVKGYIATEVTRIFCPVTYFNMNSIANGFLNAPNSPYGIAGPVNYFDYDPDLKYNEEAMQRDIEKYGLYTYDDFKDYISEEAYNSSTAVYLKVAEGKGLITFEEILIVINYLLEGSLIN